MKADWIVLNRRAPEEGSQGIDLRQFRLWDRRAQLHAWLLRSIRPKRAGLIWSDGNLNRTLMSRPGRPMTGDPAICTLVGYLKLVGDRQFHGGAHCFAAGSMRRILVDHARARMAEAGRAWLAADLSCG
jgi:hypothetical protein